MCMHTHPSNDITLITVCCREPFLLPTDFTEFSCCSIKVGYTLVTLPRTVTQYRDSVDGTRDRVTYQKLGTR